MYTILYGLYSNNNPMDFKKLLIHHDWQRDKLRLMIQFRNYENPIREVYPDKPLKIDEID